MPISRREFLKTSVAAGAVASMGNVNARARVDSVDFIVMASIILSSYHMASACTPAMEPLNLYTGGSESGIGLG